MKLQSSLIQFRSTAALAVMLAGLNVASADLVTYTGTGSSGKWNTPSNWTPATVPDAGDDVLVVQSGSKAISVDLNFPYEADGGLSSLLVNASGNGTMTLNSSKTLTVNGTETIGSSGKGAFNQNRGNHTAGQLLLAVSSTTDLGTFTLKKGTLTVQSDLIAGVAGKGVFTQRKGSVQIDSDLILGDIAASEGSYTINRGTLTVAGSTVVGNEGEGFFTQTKGKSSQSALIVGAAVGSEGLAALSRGTMNSGIAYIGDAGVGGFKQSGGTHNVQTDLVLGASNGGTGSYLLSRGTLNVGNDLIVGPAGSGEFLQTGGKVAVTGNVFLNGGSSYSLADSTLSASDITVSAGASFAASGSTGRIRVSGNFLIDEAASVDMASAQLVIAKDSDVTLSVNGTLEDGVALGRLTLEKNITLTLEGDLGNALYVDVFDAGVNSVFRLDSIIIADGIDIYYNADNTENRYLAGLTYNLGNGGRLIPISTEEEEASVLAGSGTIGGSLTMGLLHEGSGSLVVQGVSTYVAGTTVSAGDFLLSESFAFGTLSESEFSSPTVGVVPEPSTWGLVVLGLVAVLFRRRTMFAR